MICCISITFRPFIDIQFEMSSDQSEADPLHASMHSCKITQYSNYTVQLLNSDKN